MTGTIGGQRTEKNAKCVADSRAARPAAGGSQKPPPTRSAVWAARWLTADISTGRPNLQITPLCHALKYVSAVCHGLNARRVSSHRGLLPKTIPCATGTSRSPKHRRTLQV